MINDTFFDVIVTLCIILNTVFLAIEHHGMSEDLQYVLDIGNKVRLIKINGFCGHFTISNVNQFLVLNLIN